MILDLTVSEAEVVKASGHRQAVWLSATVFVAPVACQDEGAVDATRGGGQVDDRAACQGLGSLG